MAMSRLVLSRFGFQRGSCRCCNDPAVRPSELQRLGTIGLVAGASLLEAAKGSSAVAPDDPWEESAEETTKGWSGARINDVSGMVAGMPSNQRVLLVAFRHRSTRLGIGE